MKTIRRYFSAFFLGLFTLAALLIASAQFAQALKPAEPLAASIALSGDAPDIAAFNLGDCLRDTDRRTWPPAYALICTDLTMARIRAVPTPIPQPAQKKTSLPELQTPAKNSATSSAFILPVPLPRPATPLVTQIAVSPTCLIDEHGGTILLNETRHTLPPQTVARRDRSRAGIALLVPAACGVKSPMTAKVLFADNFKGYRGVVILGLSSNRRLIVAGLDALRVKRGDKVERGTVLGSTLPAGAPALVTAFNADVKRENSLLFFDLRNSKGMGLDVYWLADAS